jgi:chaperone required for assembly of F1-ATPase
MKPPQSAGRKRFYQSAAVEELKADGFAVTLDGRTVKTPAGRQLVLPTRALAEAVASEWNAQGETIEPSSLPLTKLANTAIDGVADRKTEVADEILKYAATDLVCYRAAYPAQLAARQANAWDPVLSWASERYRAPFFAGSGIAPLAQPPASLEALRGAVAPLNAFKLAALHVMTTLTGSALIALAHIDGHLDADAAWAAAHIDETWQAQQWGEDFEAAERLKARRTEFENASRFYNLAHR